MGEKEVRAAKAEAAEDAWVERINNKLEKKPEVAFWGTPGVAENIRCSWSMGDFTIGAIVTEIYPGETHGRTWGVHIWGALQAEVRMRFTRKPTVNQIILGFRIIGLSFSD